MSRETMQAHNERVLELIDMVMKKFHEAVTLVAPGPPCIVDVLNPSWRITARRSFFCKGFVREAVNTLLASFGSVPLYALTAMMGVLVFLLFVLLIYRAAPSPSRTGI